MYLKKSIEEHGSNSEKRMEKSTIRDSNTSKTRRSAEKEKEQTQSNPGELGRQRLESTVGQMLKLKEYGKRQQQKKTTIEAL